MHAFFCIDSGFKFAHCANLPKMNTLSSNVYTVHVDFSQDHLEKK